MRRWTIPGRVITAGPTCAPALAKGTRKLEAIEAHRRIRGVPPVARLRTRLLCRCFNSRWNFGSRLRSSW